LLGKLRIEKSHSRPRVSNDNPFSESQFKTLKYHPEFPDRFGSFEEARAFIRAFVDWYNHEHHQEGINLPTPAVVHSGRAEEVLAARSVTMDRVHGRNPDRFVRGKPVVKPLPREVWINRPLTLAKPPDTRHHLVQKVPAMKQGSHLGPIYASLVRDWRSRQLYHYPKSDCALAANWSHLC
jgi:hypothetical protein